MTQRGEHLALQIQEELNCPECGYSLRGLSGDVIKCPECGTALNLSGLIAAQWRGPWYYAPLYNTLALPLAWGFLTSMASLIFLSITSIGSSPPAASFAAVGIVIWGGWAYWLVVVARRFGNREGVLLALLLHFVLPAYAFGIMGAVGVIMNAVQLSDSSRGVMSFRWGRRGRVM